MEKAWKICQFCQKRASKFTSSLYYIIVIKIPTDSFDWKTNADTGDYSTPFNIYVHRT